MSKFKPFNLEEAKAGKPVCTIEGKPARIVCFDVKNDKYSIAALIDFGEKEDVYCFTSDGKFIENDEHHLYNLVMLPVKKEGYINIYTDGPNFKERRTDPTIFNTLKEAEEGAFSDCITTIKIEWEE